VRQRVYCRSCAIVQTPNRGVAPKVHACGDIRGVVRKRHESFTRTPSNCHMSPVSWRCFHQSPNSVAVIETTPSRNAMVAMINVPARVIFTFHYHFVAARTTKRFPSPRCALAIQIVCSRESTVETQPKLQPALLRLSAMTSQYLTQRILPLSSSTQL